MACSPAELDRRLALLEPTPTSMQKRHSDACERNKDPIAEVLTDYLDDGDAVWEIGCGTGQHAVYFADTFPHADWYPTDRKGRLESMRARRRDANLPNLQEPQTFDLFDKSRPEGPTSVDVIVAVNVLHIAPWEATERLFVHAGSSLPDEGVLYVYGPFRYESRPLEESNQQFDRQLRARDPQMGLRVFEEIEEVAADHGFELVEDRAMPANNRSLIWRRAD
ncbi:MAG: DUF938 domain-containing protein [Bradymonadaceae bacterium]